MVTRRITANPSTVTGTAATDQKYESTLEQDYFVLLRFDPWVERFEEQPVTIPWTDETGKMRKYTPDVLVHFRTDVAPEDQRPPLLCEIKPDLDDDGRTTKRRRGGMKPRTENMEENRMKWEAAEHYATAQGWHFKVEHERDIRTPYLENARFLLGFIERPITPFHEADLLENLARRGPMTARDLLATITQELDTRALILPTFYRLVGQRRIFTDLSQPFNLSSMVSIPEHG